MISVHDFSAVSIDGRDVALSDYRGRTLLIVNVASKCGFTPQYEGLEALYRKHRSRGLEILGFPCDQFGHQEPGNEEAIRSFCSLNYDVSFPLFAKVLVNGDDAHPLFAHLKREAKGVLGTGSIKWNFTKFLVDGEGRVRKRYSPTDTPASIEKDIVTMLD